MNGYRRVDAGKRSAFTLVELLVVVSLLALVIGVVGASLAAGIRAWQVAKTFGAAEAQAMVGTRILKRDVRSTFTFYAIPFKGSRQAMSFPAIIDVRPQDENPAPRLGSVSYRYNRYNRTLERQAAAFASEVVPPVKERESLIREVDDLVIRYGEIGEGGLTWESEWDNTTNHPEVVEVELTIATDAEPLLIRETIVAPVPTIEEEE